MRRVRGHTLRSGKTLRCSASALLLMGLGLLLSVTFRVLVELTLTIW